MVGAIAEMGVGYAGLKDRHAVTRQRFSVHLPRKVAPDLAGLVSDDLKVIEASWHSRKLPRGALAGNRFELFDPNAMDRAEAELSAVGLGARMHHYPAQMSGGEQQRVALARAAAPRPAILLADEPTGNLDSANGAAIMDLIFALRDRHGATLVLVTHAPELAARCDRVVRLADGRVVGEGMA